MRSAIFVAATLLALPSIAAAPKPTTHEIRLDVGEDAMALQSSDAARIETAIVDTRLAGKAGGGRKLTAAIVERLKKGLPLALAEKALDTLGELEDAAAIDGCALYFQHRDPDVRVSAVRCFAGVQLAGGATLVTARHALLRGLDDVDPRVRSMAATNLGKVKDPKDAKDAKEGEALPSLVLALDKGVAAASASIGAICEGAACNALLDRLKSMPLDVIGPGLQELLARPDIDDPTKLAVIKAMRALETKASRAVLVDAKAALPPKSSVAVRTTLAQAIADLEGAVR